MNLPLSDPLTGLLGGALIGAGSLLTFAATHKVPGISGVFGRILRLRRGDTAWRVVMILSMIVGAGLMFRLFPQTAAYASASSPVLLAIAGLIVGFGTRLGGGCTSGHGVCGIGRGVRDSMIATLIFMAAGMLTVWIVLHLWKGGIE